jgi:hypothetical protein
MLNNPDKPFEEPEENERWIGGVPKRIFHKGLTGVYTVILKSGLKAKVLLNRNTPSIKIYSEHQNRTFSFSARKISSETIEFTVKTLIDGHKHPDLYAKRLFVECIKYFQINGMNVNMVQSRWYGWSVNKKIFDQEINDPYGSQRLAASKTWTGKMLASLGFEVEEVDISDPEVVKVLFRRNK